MSAYRSLLSNSRLTRLLLGEGISAVGDWLYFVAMLVIVYDVAQDPFLLGLIGAARVVPYAVLSVPAGVLADRFDRRTIMIVTNGVRAVLMVVLAVLVATGAPPITIVALAIVSTTASAFFAPALAAYLPSLARDERELGIANSARETIDSLAVIVGPSIGAVLLSAGGTVFPFVLNAASFLVAALVVLTLPHGRPGRAATGHADHDETIGMAPERSLVSILAGPIALDLVTSVVGGALSMLTVVIAVDHLASGEAGTGALNAATGVGGLAASILVARFITGPLGRPLLGAALVGAGSLLVLALVRDLSVALVAIGVAVGALLVLDVVNVTLVQRVVPDALRGRGFGVLHSIGASAFAIGSFGGPVTAGMLGVPVTLVALAVACVGLTVVALLVLRRSGALAPSPAADEGLRLLLASPFGSLSGSRLGVAAQRLRARSVRAREVVVREGDAADAFYLIEAGEFRVTEGGQQRRTLGPGAVFGEIGLLTSGTRTATVEAVTDARLFVLDREPFLELAGGEPAMTRKLLALYRSPGGARL